MRLFLSFVSAHPVRACITFLWIPCVCMQHEIMSEIVIIQTGVQCNEDLTSSNIRQPRSKYINMLFCYFSYFPPVHLFFFSHFEKTPSSWLLRGDSFTCECCPSVTSWTIIMCCACGRSGIFGIFWGRQNKWRSEFSKGHSPLGGPITLLRSPAPPRPAIRRWLTLQCVRRAQQQMGECSHKRWKFTSKHIFVDKAHIHGYICRTMITAELLR